MLLYGNYVVLILSDGDDPMLAQCCTCVVDCGTALNLHWVIVSWSLFNHQILQVECRPLTCCIVLIVWELRNVFTAHGYVELIIYATNTCVTQCWFHAGLPLRRCPSVKTTSKWSVKLKGTQSG